MKTKIIKKLRSRAGESIAETLVALLISCLALIMLAEAMSASSGIITKSRAKLKLYYDAAECMDNRESSASGSEVYRSGDGTATIKDLYSDPTGKKMQDQSADITYYKNGEFGNTPVVAYKIKE